MTNYQSVAGQFFPESPEEQQEAVRQYLKEAKNVVVNGKIKALIVPHAGWVYSGVVAAAGYKKLITKNLKLKTNIILIGPSHRESFRGVVEGVLDHSVEVQIPFIKEVLTDSEVVSLVYGDINYLDLSEEIKKRITENSIIIVSSDLSHYYPYGIAVKIDSNANKFIPEIDIENTIKKVEACGITGILALLTIAKEQKWKGKLLDYKNSGDTTREMVSVVGYGCYTFYE